MVRYLWFILLEALFLVIYVSSHAQERCGYMAADKLSEDEVASCGEVNFFFSEEISDEVFDRMRGLSYGEGCTMPLDELRYIRVLHYNAEGEILVGELVVNRAIAEDVLEIFKTLYTERYPIERMVLVDDYGASDLRSMEANNSSAFNFRYIAGTTRLSKHSLGLAIDINPLYNPYVRYRGGKEIVEPAESACYKDREQEHPYMIKKGDLLYREFIKHGFSWGGSWQSVKDYQHFDKRIE